MGLGDEIMVTGEARRLQRRDPRSVAVAGADGRARWHALWRGNPRLAGPAEVAAGAAVQWLVNHPGRRPYHAKVTAERFFFSAWRATPGELFFDAGERAFAAAQPAPFVVVEPAIKASASPNKDWGFERFQRVVARRAGLPWLQLGAAGTRRLAGVRHLVTPDFRRAAAVLGRARAYLGPEGGLHHAAAALGVPAVVIFGAFTAPANTGYAGHLNIYRPHGDGPCGRRRPCPDCAERLAAITPDEVAAALDRLLRWPHFSRKFDEQ